MKILYVKEYYPQTSKDKGCEDRTYNLAKRLAKKNEIVVLTSWQKGQPRASVMNHVRIIRVGKHHTKKNNTLNRLRLANSFKKKGLSVAKTFKPDIISGEDHISYTPSLYLAKACHAKTHLTYFNKQNMIEKLLTSRALTKKWNKIIVTNKTSKNKLIKTGIPKRKITIIPTGLNLKKIKKITKLKTPHVCYVGNLTKNVNTLIKALSNLNIPNLSCTMIGVGTELGKLKRLGEQLKLHITFYLGKKDVLKEISKAWVYCDVSTIEEKTLRKTQATGTSYVIANTPLNKELGKKGGDLFKTNNVKDLTKKLKQQLTKKTYRIKKEREGRKESKKYDWNNIIKKYEKEI